MTDKMIEVRCPHCGQRMALHNNKATEFTCINCKTVQSVTGSLMKNQRLILTKEEFVDIFMHPLNYPQSTVASVITALIFMPMNQWPKEIQKQYDQYRKRRRTRFIVMSILLLLFCLLITGGI